MTSDEATNPKPDERLARRLFLFKAAAVLAGAAAIGAAAAVTVPGVAQAQGCSDQDEGQNADPEGRGRFCRRQPARWCTDRDLYDARGRGRRCK